MKNAMLTIIKKDFIGVTVNKNLFTGLLVVPFVFTVFLPTLFICLIHFMPNDPDLQKMLAMIPQTDLLGDKDTSLAAFLINYMFPTFFLIIPTMTSSVMAASSFVGEKERNTLETLLYCPLSVNEIFKAKVFASFLLSMLVSTISFVVMVLVVEIESIFILGSVVPLSLSWLFILILLAPAISLIAVTLIVRGSAKAQTVEESQQKAIFLLLPILLLFVGQMMGVLLLNVWVLALLGVICALLAWILLRKCMVGFNYETLLK